MSVPFFRPAISQAEIDEVIACLRSGWLTTGPRVKRFGEMFAERTGAKHAIPVTSCTAALHLAVEALDLRPGQAVLVPTLTFAATAAVVCYQGALPLLVDCDPRTLNIDLVDAERKLEQARRGELPPFRGLPVVGLLPVHVGGQMIDMGQIKQFAARHRLWVVEDGAHALPAACRTDDGSWRRCGEDTADVTCFSFYANKTITTGEGGMAVTGDERVADRIRQMSLHGLSQSSWKRYSGGAAWDYQILAPGFKYNLTDIAAAIGIHQLERAEAMRREREAVADRYDRALAGVEELELPTRLPGRILSWHLYPIRLHLGRLSIDRNRFMEELRRAGVGCSVHWRPLHLHPYYEERFGWKPGDLPVATVEWERLISLPIFPGMRAEEQRHVVHAVEDICRRHARPAGIGTRAGLVRSKACELRFEHGGPPAGRPRAGTDAPAPRGAARESRRSRADGAAAVRDGAE